MYHRKKTSFLGDLIFIIILVVAVFIFLRQMSTNEITQIERINKEFGVNGSTLVPDNTYEYIAQLNSAKSKDFANTLIEYSKLDLEAKEINKLVALTVTNNNNCISKNFKSKVNAFILKQNRITKLFDKQKNNKKLNRLNWNNYIDNLKNTKEYSNLKIELLSLPFCS